MKRRILALTVVPLLAISISANASVEPKMPKLAEQPTYSMNQQVADMQFKAAEIQYRYKLDMINNQNYLRANSEGQAKENMLDFGENIGSADNTLLDGWRNFRNNNVANLTAPKNQKIVYKMSIVKTSDLVKANGRLVEGKVIVKNEILLPESNLESYDITEYTMKKIGNKWKATYRSEVVNGGSKPLKPLKKQD